MFAADKKAKLINMNREWRNKNVSRKFKRIKKEKRILIVLLVSFIFYMLANILYFVNNDINVSEEITKLEIMENFM